MYHRRGLGFIQWSAIITSPPIGACSYGEPLRSFRQTGSRVHPLRSLANTYRLHIGHLIGLSVRGQRYRGAHGHLRLAQRLPETNPSSKVGSEAVVMGAEMMAEERALGEHTR